MYQRYYEIPEFWQMKLSQETKRCLNFISNKVSEGAIKVTREEDRRTLDITLTIADNVDNPIDILKASKIEIDSYHNLLYKRKY